MGISDTEQRYLKRLELLIGFPIPRVSDLHSYTIGYTLENDQKEANRLMISRIKTAPFALTCEFTFRYKIPNKKREIKIRI